MNPHNPFRRGRVSEEALVQRGSVADPQPGGPLPLSLVASLLDTVDRPLLVAERGGRILFANLRAQQCLNPSGAGTRNPTHSSSWRLASAAASTPTELGIR